MIFFQRLFATYYFFVVKLRKVQKGLFRDRDPDFTAVGLVLISQIFLLSFVVVIIKNFFGFNITTLLAHTNFPKIIILLILGLCVYLNYRYFMSNRERRNKFIDGFRELNRNQKTLWNIIALLLILTPVWLLFFLISK